MRCKACDAALSDQESTRKGVFTGEFIDLCNPCYATIKEDISVIERPDGYDVPNLPLTNNESENEQC